MYSGQYLPNETSNEVTTYRYRRPVMSWRGPDKTLTEYYIPTMQIGFNECGVFKLESPRHLLPVEESQAKISPLTKKVISLELAIEIKKVTEQTFPDEAFKILRKKEVFMSLFANAEREIIEIGHGILKSQKKKVGFFENYHNKGTNVLKKALINYILYDEKPTFVSLEKIYELVDKLDVMEKKSLIDSIRIALKTEDGNLTQMRTKEINDITQKYGKFDVFAKGITGALGGAVLSAMVRTHPIVGAGVGFFCGWALNTGFCAQHKNEANLLWDQREMRAQSILQRIKIDTEEDKIELKF